MRVKGKIAVVTGAFGGIGKASAEALAREGATVIALDVKPETPDYATSGIEYRTFDVRSDGAWKELAGELGRSHGRLDIFVAAAGVTAYESLHEVTDAIWDHVVEVNQTGLMRAFRALIPVMKAGGGGSIVTISSIFGLGAVDHHLLRLIGERAPGLLGAQVALAHVVEGRGLGLGGGFVGARVVRKRDGDRRTPRF